MATISIPPYTPPPPPPTPPVPPPAPPVNDPNNPDNWTPTQKQNVAVQKISNGEPNVDESWVTDTALLLPAHKLGKLRTLQREFDAAVKSLFANITDSVSFSTSSAEAAAYLANPLSPTPFLSSVAASSGTSVADLAQLAALKTANFNTAVGNLSGKRSKAEQDITSAVDMTALNAVTWTIGPVSINYVVRDYDYEAGPETLSYLGNPLPKITVGGQVVEFDLSPSLPSGSVGVDVTEVALNTSGTYALGAGLTLLFKLGRPVIQIDDTAGPGTYLVSGVKISIAG